MVSKLNIVKTEQGKDMFFRQSSPEFLITEVSKTRCDIWLAYIEYLEKKNHCDLYDQNGGEIISHIFCNANGLVRCKYAAYGILFDEDDDPTDLCSVIEGYIIKDEIGTYFLVSKIF